MIHENGMMKTKDVPCYVCGKTVQRVMAKHAICFTCKQVKKGAWQTIYVARLHALHKKYRPDLPFKTWNTLRTRARRGLE